MKKAKRTRLEARGWRLGSAAEFLELSAEDAALVETKLALSSALRALREAKKLTQRQLAALLKSSQSRVAKMEAGDPSVSVDLLLKGLFALGVNPREVGLCSLPPEVEGAKFKDTDTALLEFSSQPVEPAA